MGQLPLHIVDWGRSALYYRMSGFVGESRVSIIHATFSTNRWAENYLKQEIAGRDINSQAAGKDLIFQALLCGYVVSQYGCVYFNMFKLKNAYTIKQVKFAAGNFRDFSVYSISLACTFHELRERRHFTKNFASWSTFLGPIIREI